MARVVLPQSRVRAHRRRRRLFIIAWVVGMLVIILGGLIGLSWAPFLRIHAVEVSGEQTLASSSVSQVALKALQGTYLGVLARDNIFLYSKQSISSTLMQELTSVARVEVHVKNFQTLAVVISERQPKALWCGVSPPTDDADPPCYFLDADGVTYAPVTGFSGNGYTRYFGHVGTSTMRQYITSAYFHSLSAIVDALPQLVKNDPATKVFVDSNNDAHVIFRSNFELIFALAGDGADIYQRFALALQSDPFKTRTLSDFLYLDLRFGDKLYYKLK